MCTSQQDFRKFVSKNQETMCQDWGGVRRSWSMKRRWEKIHFNPLQNNRQDCRWDHHVCCFGNSWAVFSFFFAKSLKMTLIKKIFIWSPAFAVPRGSCVTDNTVRTSGRNRCSYNRIVLHSWGSAHTHQTDVITYEKNLSVLESGGPSVSFSPLVGSL